MTITVYSKKTGQINKVVESPIGMEDVQCSVEESWIPGGYSDEGFYIFEGQAVSIPARPTENHKFNFNSKEWEDSLTLDDYKALKRNSINRLRSGSEFGGFTHEGHEFDSDQTSQSKIQGAVQMALLAKSSGQPFSIEWTLADNSVRALNADEMIGVGLALGEHVNSIHIKARALKDQVAAAQTKEELDAIVW